MENINFEVGAKAARLIGRENIADGDGALIELVKNAYDADATCVCVWFDMPFPYVPTEISAQKLQQILSEEDRKEILKYYDESIEGEFHKKSELTEEETNKIRQLFAKYNCLVVADNGVGMSLSDVKTKWMYIGTSDKEVNYTSGKGRIKTGAKGIGRFALDKLSVVSRMLTKCEEDRLIDWRINWEQFENSKLLNQITAELNQTENTYIQTVRNILGNRFQEAFTDKHDWTKGTTIILSPIREEWSMRLFEKVNTNLKSINPLGTVDPFKVYVCNRYYPEYDYETADVSISVKDYDYKIKVSFDGEKMLSVKLRRNEVDVHRKYVQFKKFKKKVSLDSFWSRPYFQNDRCHREQYEQEVLFDRDMTKVLDDDPAKIRNVGSFKAELYFVKNQGSDAEIIKGVKAKSRKELLAKFSGVKIYRDKFKVRPYGDDGTYFDWLELGKRQADSPGGVGSESGSWRVLAYQLIGQVQIGRELNPALYDMANREGLTQNDEYQIFVDILQEAIRIFETDRQGFYREYTRWHKEIEKTFGVDANIRADAIANVEMYGETRSSDLGCKDSKGENAEDNHEESNRQEGKYTDEEYQKTVYNLMKEVEEVLNAKQILQLLSSSGLILNTFFHEFKGVQAHYGSRAAQLRHRVNYMIENKNIQPGFVYDPFIIIDKMESTDEMLALWLKVAMEGTQKDKLQLKKVCLGSEIAKIIKTWEELLVSKDILVELSDNTDSEKKYMIAHADLYIILNNFLLNSVYFLEKKKNPERMIKIILQEQEDYFYLNLWNNGPELDEKYKDVQNRIFELGETSKNPAEGTGIGLWIMRETIERYDGTIAVSDLAQGFGLDIYLKK
ncbi:MAG: sensor histidine kinase [Lachnospiraceae bacterium]|nr:sensor histidine kinase [Lachnospiraceae bacterium]